MKKFIIVLLFSMLCGCQTIKHTLDVKYHLEGDPSLQTKVADPTP